MAQLAPGLAGPHELRRQVAAAQRSAGAVVAERTRAQAAQQHGAGAEQEQQQEQQKEQQQGGGPCCDHGVAAGAAGAAGPVAPSRAERLAAIWNDENLEMDPGLAQCCIQDMEESEKYRQVLGALRRVDPVARAERLANAVALEAHGLIGLPMTPAEWARQTLSERGRERVGRWEQAPLLRRAVNSLHDRPLEGSDDELDAFLDGFGAQTLHDGDAGAGAASATATATATTATLDVSRCSDELSLAEFLTRREAGVLVKLVAFLAPLSQPELGHAVVAALGSQVAGEPRRRIAAAAVDFEMLGRAHALFRAAWFRERAFPLRDAPFVVAFDATGLEPQFGFSRVDLERSLATIGDWWQVYLRAWEAGAGRRAAARDAGADDRPSSSFCGRAGCPRTFPHEHVRRLNKAAELELEEEEEEDERRVG
jgi:hypothetical protein